MIAAPCARFGEPALTDLQEHDDAPDQHPLDPIQRFLAYNGWDHERVNDNELTVEIGGRWCAYRIWFGWEGELQSVMMSCAFDMRVPEKKLTAVHSLLAYVNERLWVGHFDVFTDESVPTYRHALLLGGQDFPHDEQLADLLDITISECERFYPAFQYVIRGGKSASEAVQAAIIDPIGEA
ncbi:MAG: hypothetical protein CMM46_07170 [Rhodospirillaceae bacterium]|nr:hypothetical protein [Rhodospirillaceae bacterium]|tara:strand:- start:984 stop:1526 length:543 start_codon:yes stop_codon:yes gene_type:complete